MQNISPDFEYLTHNGKYLRMYQETKYAYDYLDTIRKKNISTFESGKEIFQVYVTILYLLVHDRKNILLQHEFANDLAKFLLKNDSLTETIKKYSTRSNVNVFKHLCNTSSENIVWYMSVKKEYSRIKKIIFKFDE